MSDCFKITSKLLLVSLLGEPQLQIILASSSKFRKTVLEKLQLPFVQISPDIDESVKNNESAKNLVERLAIEKAQAVADALVEDKGSLIIASDQVAECNGVVFGKPGDHQTAIEQLQYVSGNRVNFYTSLVLMNSATNNLQKHLDLTRVHFRNLDRNQIETYLNIDKPYNCAGSFKSEAFGAALFTKIETDDPDALIGLPLLKLVAMLAEEGVDPLKRD
jgi:MAF protein